LPPAITKLPNGLTVITDPMAHLETAAVGIWVDAGARNETEATNGIAHMLEHMAFKGTKRRSARAIAEEIERVGGFINAYTGREQTAYYARVLKDDVALAVDILADILQDSVFDNEELAREKGVVIQEIGQAEDTPDDIIFDHLQSQAFPEQPLGRPILGTEAHVNSFTRETLIAQISGNYCASGMLLVSAGAVDHDEMVALANQHFAKLPGGKPATHRDGNYRGGEFRADDDLEQAHIALAFKGFHSSDEDIYAVQVYSTVLGGGMSSRLFQEAREKRGLCYSIHTFGSSYADTGLFGVYAGTSAKDASELVSVIAGEMKSLAAGAGEDEVVRARAQIKSGLLMGMEQASARCEQMAGQYLIYGRLIDTRELIAKINAIDTRAVSRIAAKILASGPLTLAALGPMGPLGSYDAIAQRFE
jgi:predicted Zn-dependent peptidase